MERTFTEFASQTSSSRGGQQLSLAESLRQRRQFMEHIEQERAMKGKPTHMRYNTNSFPQKAPAQTDESGSAFRVRNQRPQTPRINLLKAGREKYREGSLPRDHPLFSEQAQIRKKPFNALNPNAKIGIDNFHRPLLMPEQIAAQDPLSMTQGRVSVSPKGKNKSPKSPLKLKASAIKRVTD